MDIGQYETEKEQSDDNNKLLYSFISNGKKEIPKLIAYQKLNYNIKFSNKDTLHAYNLGFGDKKENSFEIDDNVNSNNGDMWKVFNTVLHTVPEFFKQYGDSCISVRGSDDRRIKLYCLYVSKNYEQLSKEFNFFGVTNGNLVPFKKGIVYDSVVFYPK